MKEITPPGGAETRAQISNRERAALKKAGWESMKAYGRSGPYFWRRPGETEWMSRDQAVKVVEDKK